MKVFSDLGKLVTGRRRPVALLVDDGRVWCPARGDIGVEECVGCPRMLAFDGRELTCRDDRPWWFARSAQGSPGATGEARQGPPGR